MSAIVTKHAAERGDSRLGLRLGSLTRMAELALENGIKHSETSGSLKRYIDKLFLTHRNGSNIRIYGETVFIFAGEILVTVLPLDNRHKKTVKKIKEANRGR